MQRAPAMPPDPPSRAARTRLRPRPGPNTRETIEKDPALTRRFQVVQVAEPSEEKRQMVRGVASMLEKHHRVMLLDEALEAAVRLSHRYIPARQLPDKAVSLLDTVCARGDQPARRPAAARGLPAHHRGAEHRARDHRPRGGRRRERRRSSPRVCEEKLAAAEGADVELEARWEERRRWRTGCSISGSFARPRTPRRRLPSPPQVRAGSGHRSNAPEERSTLLAMGELQKEAHRAAGRIAADPLRAWTSRRSAVVEDWTGVPVGRMVKNEVESLLNLAETLNQRVVGQRHARHDCEAYSHLAGQARQSQQADRRLHAVRTLQESARPRPR